MRLKFNQGRENMSEFEQDEIAGKEENEGVSRYDFLKSLGIGLGAAGLGAVMGGQALADGEKKGKYVVVITNGGNDPNRAILALILASVAADKGWGSVNVWMTLEGADLACKSKAERIESAVFKKFGNAMELMKKLKEKGAWFGVCPPCLDYFAPTDKVEFVEKAGGDWLLKNIQDAWVVWM
jgi:predicted peroxiredoxin